MKCYRCMRLNSMSSARCSYCGEQLKSGKVTDTTIGFDPRPIKPRTTPTPLSKPIDVVPVSLGEPRNRNFGHSTIRIPETELLFNGNPISNAQQIERNRGQVSVNKNQQSFLTLKNKNFIETEYGDNTNLFGNYAPDEDDYETTTQEPSYNYKKSADELMKERNNM